MAETSPELAEQRELEGQRELGRREVNVRATTADELAGEAGPRVTDHDHRGDSLRLCGSQKASIVSDLRFYD
jgi:hypothetical protein